MSLTSDSPEVPGGVSEDTERVPKSQETPKGIQKPKPKILLMLKSIKTHVM
jgi:hypothetical protein